MLCLLAGYDSFFLLSISHADGAPNGRRLSLFFGTRFLNAITTSVEESLLYGSSTLFVVLGRLSFRREDDVGRRSLFSLDDDDLE